MNARAVLLARWLGLLAVFLLACTSAPRRFELAAAGSHGSIGWLELDVPAGWSAVATRGRIPGGDLTIYRIDPGGGIDLNLQVSPLYPSEPEAFVRDRLREVVESLARTSVESELPVKELVGPGCRASYVSASDRTVSEASAGEFKFIDQGAADLGAVALTFTLLTNDPIAPERSQALEIVRFARFVPSGSASAWARKVALTDPLVLAVPGRRWRVEIDLEGYALEDLEFAQRRTMIRAHAENEAQGMIASAFLEPAKPGWTAQQYRERAFSALPDIGPLERVDVRRSARPDRAILEYRTRFPEEGWSQIHRNVYLVHDGYWIDVHLSKINPGPGDEGLLEAVTESIRIRE